MRSEVVVFLESFLEFASHLGDVACREVAAPEQSPNHGSPLNRQLHAGGD